MTQRVCVCYFADLYPFICFNQFIICYVHHLGLYCLLRVGFLIAQRSFAVDKVVILKKYTNNNEGTDVNSPLRGHVPPKYEPSERLVAATPSSLTTSTTPSSMKNILSHFALLLKLRSFDLSWI